MSEDVTDYFKTDDQKANDKTSDEVAKKIKTHFKGEKGQEVLRLLKNYFDCHIPSTIIANHDHARTNFHDGQKSVLYTIDNILDGTIK